MKCADCGGVATDYDHRDYRKPLEVTAVCGPCNRRRGRGLTGMEEKSKLANRRRAMKLMRKIQREGAERIARLEVERPELFACD